MRHEHHEPDLMFAILHLITIGYSSNFYVVSCEKSGTVVAKLFGCLDWNPQILFKLKRNRELMNEDSWNNSS